MKPLVFLFTSLWLCMSRANSLSAPAPGAGMKGWLARVESSLAILEALASDVARQVNIGRITYGRNGVGTFRLRTRQCAQRVSSHWIQS